MTLSFPHSDTTHTFQHCFFFLFFFLSFFFQSLKMLRWAAAHSRGGRDSSRRLADRKSLRSHGRHKPGCTWRVLILSSFFIMTKGNWFYFIVEDNPKRMFFNKSVVLFWLLKTTNLMAVVTVFATSHSRQDRCGLCFRVAHFLFLFFFSPIKPPLPFGTFFLPQSSVLHMFKWESLKNVQRKKSVTHMLRLAEQLLKAAVDGLNILEISCCRKESKVMVSPGKQTAMLLTRCVNAAVVTRVLLPSDLLFSSVAWRGSGSIFTLGRLTTAFFFFF